MYLLKQILPAVLLAITVAAGGQGLAVWRGSGRAQRALAPVALGLGYFCGHFFITGWTPFPPADTTNWIPYFGLAAAGLGAFWWAFSQGATVRMFLLALLAIGAFRLLLAPKFRYGWTAGQGWLWVISLGCAVVLLGLVLRALVRRSSPIELPFVLLIVSAGTSGALMLSGSLLLGQFGAVFAGALFGVVVFSLRGSEGIEGIVPIFALLSGVLLACGYFFAALPAWSALLLAGAPILALVPAGGLSGLPRAALRIILVSLPVGVAVLLAFRASPPLDY